MRNRFFTLLIFNSFFCVVAISAPKSTPYLASDVRMTCEVEDENSNSLIYLFEDEIYSSGERSRRFEYHWTKDGREQSSGRSLWEKLGDYPDPGRYESSGFRGGYVSLDLKNKTLSMGNGTYKISKCTEF